MKLVLTRKLVGGGACVRACRLLLTEECVGASYGILQQNCHEYYVT